MRRRPAARPAAAASDTDGDADPDTRPHHRRRARADHRRSRSRGRMTSYSRWSRWVVEAFKAFGRHCARNQIRVLLVDSFVMTSLFYPALALHIQRTSIHNAAAHATSPHQRQSRSVTGPLSLFSTPLLDSFFPFPEPVLPLPLVHFPAWGDGDERWDEFFTFEPLLREEQRHQGNTSDCDLVVSPLAWTTMKRVIQWRSTLPSGPAQSSFEETLEEPTSRAFRDELLHLVDNWDALTAGEMTSVPHTTGDLASPSHTTGTGAENIYTSLQPVFRPTSLDVPLHAERFVGPWTAAVEAVREQARAEEYVYANSAQEGGVTVYRVSAKQPSHPEQEPRIPPPPTVERTLRSGIPPFIFLLYAAVILYFLFLLSRASAMHSRFGIAFTGVIQVLCSAVMSFSVMAFLGFGWGDATMARNNVAGETVVPYYLMPLVILIVGVENMATLIKAVYSTPITYSVPDRIGFGLAKAGPTLFITSVSDILALCFIAWTVKLGPVRDLCLYASVLIFVDWWMLHTFFLTVVSIDCQRLELADLLRQGVEQPRRAQAVQIQNGVHRHGSDDQRAVAGGAGGVAHQSAQRDLKTQKSGWIKGARSIWKARTARGGSMVVLLSLVTGVYYINESHQKDRLARVLGYGLGRSDRRIDLTEIYHEPAPAQSATVSNLPGSIQQQWHALNPGNKVAIDLCVFPTRAYIIPSVDIKIQPSQLMGSLERMGRPILPRIKPLFYLLKVVILPQLVTAFLLWLVLLYLLKDADLLDAQGDRANVDDTEDEHTPADESGPMSGTRLGLIARQSVSAAIPTVNLTDILEIWTDGSGSVVVVADSDNKMRIVQQDTTMSVAFADYPGSRDCVHLDRHGKRLAVAEKAGTIRVYDVKGVKSSTRIAFTFDHRLATTSLARSVLLLDGSNPFSDICSAVTMHGDGMILLHASSKDQPVILRNAITQIVSAEHHKLFARDNTDGFTRFAAPAADGTVEEWQSASNGNWMITGRGYAYPGSIVTDCLLRRFAGDQFWFTATGKGDLQLSAYPDNQILQSWKLSDEPITKLDISHDGPEPCSRCMLFQSSLTCYVLHWTKSAVGRTTLSFELPSSEVCMCNRHPGGRASLSRPVDHTPLRTYGTATKRQSNSGSSHKHRSTSPSPLSKQSRLSVDHGALLGAPGTHSRTESEEETLLRPLDGNAQRDWTVHRVSHKIWNLDRGTAIFLPAMKLLVTISKVKRDWQARLVDLDAVADTDGAEISLPLGTILQRGKSLEADSRPQSKQKVTKLAFSSIKSAAAGDRTILFGQGNVLIRLDLPAPAVATTLKRRVSTVFTVPQSANGNHLSSRHMHTPIPLRLNGTGIPQS